MANMVTRTKVVTKATIKGINTAENTVAVFELTLPKTFKSEAQVERAVRNAIPKDAPVQPSILLGYKTEEILYGMDEETFIKNAKVLPPRKVYDKKPE